MIRIAACTLLLCLPTAGCSRREAPQLPALRAVSERLTRERRISTGDTYIIVSVPAQRLYLMRDGAVMKEWPVSTAAAGTGSAAGSNKTPPGTHRIRYRYGDGAPPGTVFVSRNSTGEIAEIHTDATDSPEDLVTTRIMWLEGLEQGKNRGPGVDSFQRYIYIHGTNEEGLIGTPASHGCIRMRNRDVIELFDRAGAGTIVEIIGN
ncbi:L,D-transpeptidase [bacterium]|nr:L,D-transpeptidase [bacterium]